MSPRFSVALPVRNGARYVADAVSSVLSQTFGDFELVIGDNASIDDTAAIVAELAAEDDRIKVHRSLECLTQSRNVNRTLSLCNGEWIKILCHDDLLEAECLESIDWAIRTCASAQLGLISNAEAWQFQNGYILRQNDDKRGQFQIWHGRRFLEALFVGRIPNSLPSLTTATVYADAWRSSSGFDERDAIVADAFHWMRLLLHWDYLALGDVLTVNRIHSGQVAVAQRQHIQTQLRTCRRFYREFLRETRGSLNIGVTAQVRARCRYIAIAGSTIAINVLKNNPRGALRVVRSTPAIAAPLLPAFALRSLRQERKKIKALAQNVSVADLYPG